MPTAAATGEPPTRRARRDFAVPAQLDPQPVATGGLDIDAAGRVCITAVLIDELVCTTLEGDVLERFSAPGASARPWSWTAYHWEDVAIGPGGTMWVTQSDRSRITGLRPDGSIVGLHERVPDEIGIIWPHSADVAGDGSILVADDQRKRLYRFDSEGTFLHTIGEAAGEAGALLGPRGLSIRGDVIDVADTRGGRLQRYDLAGRWLGSWGGSSGSAPRDVAFGEDGRAHVTTSDGIEVYEAPGDARWSAAFTGESWANVASPLWRTTTLRARLPGPKPPHADLVENAAWRFTTRLRRSAPSDPPFVRYRIEAAGRVRLLADGRELLYADPEEPGYGVYTGLLPVSRVGTVVDVDYASGAEAEHLDVTWSPDGARSIYLPIAVR